MDTRSTISLLVTVILLASSHRADGLRRTRQASQSIPDHLTAYVRQLANNHQTNYQPPLPFRPPQQHVQSQPQTGYQPPILPQTRQLQHNVAPLQPASGYQPPLLPISYQQPQPVGYPQHGLPPSPYQPNSDPLGYRPQIQPQQFSYSPQSTGYHLPPSSSVQKAQSQPTSSAVYIGGGQSKPHVSPPAGNAPSVSISTSYTADVIKQGKVVGSVRPSVQAIEKAPASEIEFDKGKNAAKDKATKPDDEYVVYYYYYYDDEKKPGKNLSLNFDDIPNLESYDQPAKPTGARAAKQLVDKNQVSRAESVPSNTIHNAAPVSRRIPISAAASREVTTVPPTTTTSTTTEAPVVVPNVYRYGIGDIPRFPVTPNHLQPLKLNPVLTISQVFTPVHAKTTTTTSAPLNTTPSTTTSVPETTEIETDDYRLEEEDTTTTTATTTEATTTTTEPTTTTTEPTTTTEATTTTERTRKRTSIGRRRFNANGRGNGRATTTRRSTTTTTTTAAPTTTTTTSAPASGAAKPTRRGFPNRFSSNRFRRPSFSNNRGRSSTTAETKSQDTTSASASASTSSSTTTTTTTTQATRQFGGNRRFGGNRNPVVSANKLTSSIRSTATTAATTRLRPKPTGRSPLFGGPSRGRARPPFFRQQNKTPEPKVEEETQQQETTLPPPPSSSKQPTTEAVKEEEEEEAEEPVEEEEEKTIITEAPSTTAKPRLGGIFRPRSRPALFANRGRPKTR